MAAAPPLLSEIHLLVNIACLSDRCHRFLVGQKLSLSTRFGFPWAVASFSARGLQTSRSGAYMLYTAIFPAPSCVERVQQLYFGYLRLSCRLLHLPTDSEVLLTAIKRLAFVWVAFQVVRAQEPHLGADTGALHVPLG